MTLNGSIAVYFKSSLEDQFCGSRYKATWFRLCIKKTCKTLGWKKWETDEFTWCNCNVLPFLECKNTSGIFSCSPFADSVQLAFSWQCPHLIFCSSLLAAQYLLSPVSPSSLFQTFASHVSCFTAHFQVAVPTWATWACWSFWAEQRSCVIQ